jgi:hypothetical protein
VNTGNDAGAGSAARPFQTITRALCAAADGDTIMINSGIYGPPDPAVGTSYGELLPLQFPPPIAPAVYSPSQYWSLCAPASSQKRNLRLIGVGPTKPVLRAFYEDAFGATHNYPFDGSNAPDCLPVVLHAVEGWTIQNLRFENTGYDKSAPAPGVCNYNQIIGLAVFDLTAVNTPPLSSSVWITACEFSDNFTGIHVFDNASHLASLARTVHITSCDIRNHGPVKADSAEPTDLGHAAILLRTFPSLVINVTGHYSTNNHDGIEGNAKPAELAEEFPWNPTLNLTRSTFEQDENGFEFAEGDFEIEQCTFRLCEAKNPASGGAGSTVHGEISTSGIGLRGFSVTTSPVVARLRVRNTHFDRCQTAVQIKTARVFEYFDFGTHTLNDRGNNTFTTDTQSPWDQPSTPLKQVYNTSYCGILTTNPTRVQACGNAWTYDASYGLMYNQGVDAAASYDTAPLDGNGEHVIVDAVNGVNYVAQYGRGQPRPLQSTWTVAEPNKPWNVSVAPQASGNPAPSILVRKP